MTELKTRKIRERWIISGELELVTPASFSNGDAGGIVDLPLLTDPLTGEALLTGASLAGALRSYLHQFTASGTTRSPAEILFGGKREDADGKQSPLIVEDALGGEPRIELRDGVAIDPTTRTALEAAKYDRELLAAGTVFQIGFELVLNTQDYEHRARALAQALSGLEEGEIRLGGRKHRGLGQCRVRKWRAWRYDLTMAKGLRGWLAHDRNGESWEKEQLAPWTGARIREWEPLLATAPLTDERNRFILEGKFAIDGSVLIRAGFEAETAPDTTHLRSQRDGEEAPILSGTTLAGVIRGQALRIARTVSNKEERARDIVNQLFGYMSQNAAEEEVRVASRVVVDESVIGGDYKDLVQSRVKIDRFTGGAYESALFTEQPIFGGETTLRWEIKNPENAEIGLLLLVLKDLWTGWTTIGGEASVGRGRLRGQVAKLHLHQPDGSKQWQLEADGNGSITISGDDVQKLNQYVRDFVEAVGGAK